MRKIFLFGAFVTLFAVQAQPSHAYHGYQDGPWCAVYWGYGDLYSNCSLPSFEMCQREIFGVGGGKMCSPNPHYESAAAKPRKTGKAMRRTHHP